MPDPPDPPVLPKIFSTCYFIEVKPPVNDGGSKVIGYILERTKKSTSQWIRLNDEPFEKELIDFWDLDGFADYQYRVSAVNMAGVSQPSKPSEIFCPRDPSGKSHMSYAVFTLGV